MAVSVQRLTVPDLVVVDQPAGNQLQLTRSSVDTMLAGSQQQQNKPQSILSPSLSPSSYPSPSPSPSSSSSSSSNLTTTQQQQPEAASLINTQDLNSSATLHNSGGYNNGAAGTNMTTNQHELTFECLISYDRRKDKNLIIKWHHDDRVEPIYQWIVELDKISIAPQYKPYILANNNNSSTHRGGFTQQQQQQENLQQQQQLHQPSSRSANVGNSTGNNSHQSNQVQLLEASFRLIRPSKELGGKYTCSAISIQNDDSKWRKMIVFTPPRSFKFNATRTDFGQQLPATIPRVKQMSPSAPLPPLQLTASTTSNQPSPTGFLQTDNQHQQSITGGTDQLPLVYRSRGFDNQPASTISPQMYKTIDYVNVNPNYRPPTSSSRSTIQPMDATTSQTANIWQQQQQQQQRRLMAANGVFNGGAGVSGGSNRYSGVKLICDIDQIFPVPEVSIYRLAIGQNGSNHPMDKLTKSETRIEKNPLNGLYHIQVISVLLDDEIELKYGPNEQVYFECLIGLTNLELSKYSDNKRSLVYRRSPLTASTGSSQGMQNDMTMADDNGAFNSESSSSSSASLLFQSSTSGLNIRFKAVYVLLFMMNSLFLHHHMRPYLLDDALNS